MVTHSPFSYAMKKIEERGGLVRVTMTLFKDQEEYMKSLPRRTISDVVREAIDRAILCEDVRDTYIPSIKRIYINMSRHDKQIDKVSLSRECLKEGIPVSRHQAEKFLRLKEMMQDGSEDYGRL
jgi:hypothetical protein